MTLIGDMALLHFLLSFLLLVAAATAAISNPQETTGTGSILKLEVYHVHGSGSPLENGTSASDILARDEARISSLSYRLKKTKPVSNTVSNRSRQAHAILGPESVTVPIRSGLSIGSGNYYIKIGVGTPVKYYSMILDTGSSLSWMQCDPCSIYCHAQVDSLFDPKASKTYKPVPCSGSQCSLLKEATLNDPGCTRTSKKCVYTASYGDSSYSLGILGRDSITVGSGRSVGGFVFGCGLDNEGLFGRAAGIVGLARQPLSMLGQLSPRYGSTFSYCLPSESSKGFLSLGQGSLGRARNLKFTAMITDPQDPSLYFLRLSLIKLGGKPISLPPAKYKVPTVIDSGTVITRLPMSVYSALRTAFVKVMSKKYASAPSYSVLDACFKGSLKSVSVPPIELVFQGGAGLKLTPSNALFDVEVGITCLAFAGNAESSGIAVIGNRQQQRFEVVYDVSNSRIGFAPDGCH